MTFSAWGFWISQIVWILARNSSLSLRLWSLGGDCSFPPLCSVRAWERLFPGSLLGSCVWTMGTCHSTSHRVWGLLEPSSSWERSLPYPGWALGIVFCPCVLPTNCETEAQGHQVLQMPTGQLVLQSTFSSGFLFSHSFCLLHISNSFFF